MSWSWGLSSWKGLVVVAAERPTKAGTAGWVEVECVLCGAAAGKTLVWPDAGRGHIWRCAGCGLCFRSPRRREEEQTRHFEEKWTEGRRAFYLEDYRTRNLRRLVKWVLRRHPAPGAILDIGSSYGNFLAQFPATWRRWGIEPSNLACRIARERLPEARIIPGTLGDARLPGPIFDVITMIDTIYYLPQPLRDLARLPGLLQPGGTLLIEAPNFANRGLVYRWMRHSFGETMLFFYTPATLKKILHRIGMKVIDRIDLPGHREGSRKKLSRAMALAEYALTRAACQCSQGRLDLVPHFVLVAQPRKSGKFAYGP
jgi:SAM-dependent methyltransferase